MSLLLLKIFDLKGMKSHFLILFVFILMGCAKEEDSYVPKPRGFNRINLPAVSYQKLKGDYPYEFEYSTSALIQPDTFGLAEPYWIIIYYPSLEARIQLTYKNFGGDLQRLQAHTLDAFRLADKHLIRATGKTEKIQAFKNGKKAVIIELEGEVPSHYQFYTTDTTKHFLRGAVYLMEVSKNDSLQPVIDFLKKDTQHLLHTLRWKK